MYSGWISERGDIEEQCGVPSVLNSYPSLVGRDVTSSVIRSLILYPNEKKDFFKAERDLEWTMDVVCFGLTMPLSEVEMIKNCVYLYLEWTSVLSVKPKAGIPHQLVDRKEYYFCKMLGHLTNLFIPRESSSTPIQAKLCSQVLQHIRSIAEEQQLAKDITDAVLRFYLGISGHLLSSPPMTGGLAEHLAEQLINCLLSVWLAACCQYFPSPTLWCTLKDMFMSWRHHHTLILQWSKLMYSLTCKVLEILFGAGCPLPNPYRDDMVPALPSGLKDELIVQCWFRFLHIIGNPVHLCDPRTISSSVYFIKYTQEQGREPDAHPSLKSLPQSFYTAMKGVSVLVAMFLGSAPGACKQQSFPGGDWKCSSTGHTPPTTGKEKRFSLDSEKLPKVPSVRRSSEEVRPSPPKYSADDSGIARSTPLICPSLIAAETNSILHLFGMWIFDACFTGIDTEQVIRTVGLISHGILPKPGEIAKIENEVPASFPLPQKSDFEPGRAQAFSTLCHIFRHHNCDMIPVLPVYLARFYLSLSVGLCYRETRAGQVLGSVLLSSEDLLRIDLPGVHVLAPHFLYALETILPFPDHELNLGYEFSTVELRRSCIQLLLSMICLPHHFMTLPIQPLGREKLPSATDNGHHPPLTFLSLKLRMTNLLLQALEVESNPQNTQMLLGGAMLLIQDTVCVEMHSGAGGKSTCSVPGISFNEPDDAFGKNSPKLIHVAQALSAVDHTSSASLAETRPVRERNIGLFGFKKDLLTTKGLFVTMVGLLRQKLLFAGNWRGDLNVKLAGLEFLSGLAQLDARFIDEDESKKVVIWICDYIEYQSKRPPQSHSRDLHSIIVAAFSCISTWIGNHSWLLDNQQCLESVLEVIELGISGSKSKPAQAENLPQLKGAKELKPVSFRVREAAEALLAVVMEHSGCFPNPCGPASMSSLLDEGRITQISRLEHKRKFVYYAIDGSIIVGLLEDSVQGLSDDLPSVISIVRGPSGKKVTLLRLRHFPRDKQSKAQLFGWEPERPTGLEKIPQPPKVSQRHYPVEVDLVPKTEADMSIPDIDASVDENVVEINNRLRCMMVVQGEEELKSSQLRMLENSLVDAPEFAQVQKQPKAVVDFHSSHLFLSHMGILGLPSLETQANKQTPSLQYLGGSESSLTCVLAKLDRLSTRTFDNILVCFVRKGQRDPEAIAANKIESQDGHCFMEFLHSLAWPVTLATHTGWTGDPATSWLVDKSDLREEDLQRKIFYYSDLTNEVAVLVPSLNLKQVHGYCRPKCAVSDTQAGEIAESPEKDVSESESAKSLDSSVDSRGKKSGLKPDAGVEFKARAHNSHSETKVVVAWMQDYADHVAFPALELVSLIDPQGLSSAFGPPSTLSRVPDKEIVTIFINPLKTGLCRIKVVPHFGSSIGGPLVDGMVVSRRALGRLVRDTAINIFKRRRLDIDSYSPPHVCRKLRIQKIIRTHAQNANAPEFYASLFRYENELADVAV